MKKFINPEIENLHQSHGYTHAQVEEIRQMQIEKRVPMIPANNADNFQDEIFEKDFKGYQIPKHESLHYHIAIESRLFDPQTGKRLSIAIVQIYDVATYRMLLNMSPYDGFHGKLTHILHDPTRK